MSEHHVIFLGAGASCGSGYPLANDLRLLISSRKKWEEALVKYEDKHKLSGRPITSMGINYWDVHTVALNLFRNGGFATIDEFCYLAGGFSFQNEINSLRYLLRAALGLFNPEEKFEKSEYYGFIQSLFMPDLFTLRKGVTVISYNYDPYLEYLLQRALEHRFKVTRGGSIVVDLVAQAKHNIALNAATSGFYFPGDRKWLDEDNFCVLKLHGSIANLGNMTRDFDILFTDYDGSALERAQKFFGENTGRYTPPILFPWEIMNEKGFVANPLFVGIWERARRAVQAADKISFVGLSMHEYLEGGFRYINQRFGRVWSAKISAKHIISHGRMGNSQGHETEFGKIQTRRE